METRKYLAVSEDGRVRVVSRLTSIRGNEIPITLHLNIPDHYWETPLCAAYINLPEAPVDGINNVNANIDFGVKNTDDLENLDDI